MINLCRLREPIWFRAPRARPMTVYARADGRIVYRSCAAPGATPLIVGSLNVIAELVAMTTRRGAVGFDRYVPGYAVDLAPDELAQVVQQYRRTLEMAALRAGLTISITSEPGVATSVEEGNHEL